MELWSFIDDFSSICINKHLLIAGNRDSAEAGYILVDSGERNFGGGSNSEGFSHV